MPFALPAAAVCLISCHGASADHFATFAEHLSKEAGTIEIVAAGPALKTFRERGIEVKVPFSLEQLSPAEEDALAAQIAKTCSSASVAITDVGDAFAIKVQKALAREARQVARLAYYENPEPLVPGKYSAIAAEVMLAAQGVLFANSNLAKVPLYSAPGQEVDFGSRKKIGVGYYPIQRAETIAQRRAAEQSTLRQAFFQKNGLVDTGQKVLVYFGGNNQDYFSKAFPAFLSLLEQGGRADIVVVFQQHPCAAAENIDRHLLENWVQRTMPQAPKIIFSDFNSNEAQLLADGALYYQTSMGPQFVLAGLPTIQIGHETYEDILVRNRLAPSVTTVDQWISAVDGLSRQQQDISKEVVLEGLGIKTDWLQVLETTLKEHSS